MKTISFSLDTKSVNQAIRELQRYRDEFPQKIARLRQMIAERIQWTAQQGFNVAIAGDTFLRVDGKNKMSIQPYSSDVTVTVSHDDTVSTVLADGDQAVFIEYGAGVYHNGAPGDSPHPWGLEQGFAIGTYDKGKGVRNVWGYKDADETVILTHGTPAAMPMYRGAEEAIRALDEMVREVFG